MVSGALSSARLSTCCARRQGSHTFGKKVKCRQIRATTYFAHVQGKAAPHSSSP
jgi:hypothetical protein